MKMVKKTLALLLIAAAILPQQITAFAEEMLPEETAAVLMEIEEIPLEATSVTEELICEVQTQQEIVVQPEAQTQPEIEIEPEVQAQPEMVVQPEAQAQLEMVMQPEVQAQPETPVQPEVQEQLVIQEQPATVSQPEATQEPESEQEEKKQSQTEKDIRDERNSTHQNVQFSERTELGITPFEIKTKTKELWIKNEICEAEVEIRNKTTLPMQKLKLILRSDDSGYMILPYEKEEEAKEALWQDVLTENEKEKPERILLIRELLPGECIKTRLYIYAKADLEIAEEGIEAIYECEFQSDSGCFYKNENWKIGQKEPAEETPEMDGQNLAPEQSSDSDMEIQNMENPNTENQNIQATEEQNTLDLFETKASDTETADMETSETEEEEIVIFQADGTSAEEEFSDQEYYDDWSTYYYDGGYGGEAEQINTATPHIIVESYGHKKTIHTGDSFPVEITFLNTSQKLGMESVMVQVETSESLSLANGTNTFFVNELAPGGMATQRINLLASSQCKDATQTLTLTMKFEYVENKERKEGSSTETITLPIAQMERLELKDPAYDEMEAGKEGLISIQYVNKGYAALNNMEASIQLEDADMVQENIYIGNVESGKEGTIDFLVTPFLDGDYTGSVTLTYEDTSMQEKAVTIPIEFHSMEAYVMEELPEEYQAMEEEPQTLQASFPLVPVLCGAAAAFAVLIVTILMKRKKAKAREQDQINLDDWFGEDQK